IFLKSLPTLVCIFRDAHNGIGFDRERSHSGFGLRNMQERVQSLGGQFYLTSQPDRGTQIKIFIPM
ncbi:ATP-binding protein, partial [Tumidithrix elongata RA019]|nr:ATP-binding protein [Tumidithrix elongata RA019]